MNFEQNEPKTQVNSTFSRYSIQPDHMEELLRSFAFITKHWNNNHQRAKDTALSALQKLQQRNKDRSHLFYLTAEGDNRLDFKNKKLSDRIRDLEKV